jgi:phenylacetate-CoA ligase
MASIDGRKLDVIRTRDGKLIPGELFPHLFKEVPAIRNFQVIQRDIGEIDIKLVVDDDFEPSDEAFLQSELSKYLGAGLAQRFSYVDEIPLTPSGKRRVTVSELDSS